MRKRETDGPFYRAAMWEGGARPEETEAIEDSREDVVEEKTVPTCSKATLSRADALRAGSDA